MAGIPVKDIIADFQLMLAEHWSYSAGGASYGDVDCSGAFVWSYRQHGHSIYHGSNRMARTEILRLIPIETATVVPGMAAFKFHSPGDSSYALPNEYKAGGAYYNGDLRDFYHVGLVDTDTSRVLNAQSVSTGFVASPITQNWPYVAYLSQVDYGETPPEPSEGLVPDVQWIPKERGYYERTSTEAYNNACMVYNVLAPLGWTLNAICGLLGSIDVECQYNPWLWEGNKILASTDIETMKTSKRHGYGLVQFTPPAKYILDTNAQELADYGPNFTDIPGNQNDGTAQLQFINQYADYYATKNFPENFDEYKMSTKDTDYLTEAWVRNYERPTDPTASLARRQEAARYWYGVISKAVRPGPGPSKKRKGMPLWMLLYPF